MSPLIVPSQGGINQFTFAPPLFFPPQLFWSFFSWQGFFDSLHIDQAGSLHLKTAADRNGAVHVEVELRDDGGTVGGGSDRMRLNFTMLVQSQNSHPQFMVPAAGLTAIVTSSSSTNVFPQILQVLAFPPDEKRQNATFEIVHVSDASLFTTPISITHDGTVSFGCDPSASPALASIDVILRDDGGSIAGAQGEGVAMHTVCTSTDKAGPSCSSIFTNLSRTEDTVYSGFILRIFVANTDFSDDDEYIQGVWVGNQRFSGTQSMRSASTPALDAYGSRFMARGSDNMCGKKDQIIDMWVSGDSEALQDVGRYQELVVRVETSPNVGCCFCNGATLYVEMTLTPYAVPLFESLRQTLDIWILPQSRAASIEIPMSLSLVEQHSRAASQKYAAVVVEDFIKNYHSGIALADEIWTFGVTVEVGANRRLLPAVPTLSASSEKPKQWTLLLTLGLDEIGSASLLVTASVEVQSSRFGPQTFHTGTSRCLVRVRPLPVLMRVEPCVGAVAGGTLVTIHGYHLSLQSATDSLHIAFNGRTCANVFSLSSLVATCLTPAPHDIWQPLTTKSALPSAEVENVALAGGPGYVNVSVSLVDTPEQHQNRVHGDEARHVVLPNSFRYSLLWIGATSRTAMGLLSALSPHTHFNADVTYVLNTSNVSKTTVETRPSSFPSALATAVWNTGLETSAGLTALAVFRGRVVAAGSFETAKVNSRDNSSHVKGLPLSQRSRKAHHILSWDGESVESLGSGLDGIVYTLSILLQNLVVGGSFVRALQSHGSPLERPGPLLEWDGFRWGLLGGVSVGGGSVHASLAVGPLLYIAGSFERVGVLEASGLAVYDSASASWSAPMGAVVGKVSVMVWWQNSLVLGGSFTRVGSGVGGAAAGGLPVSGLARFMDGEWLGMGDINGPVFAVAVHESALYVGGSFSTVNQEHAALLGIYRNGHLQPLPPASGFAPVRGRYPLILLIPPVPFLSKPCVRVLADC